MTTDMTSKARGEGTLNFFTRSSPRPAASGSRRRDSVEVRSSRCPHCLIDVQTLGTAPPTICPYCRQAMVQYESKSGKSIKVILGGSDRILVFNSVSDLLPLVFDCI